jgi:hypothetical protein
MDSRRSKISLENLLFNTLEELSKQLNIPYHTIYMAKTKRTWINV